MSGKGTEATRRWRQNHPEKARAKDRRGAARRLAAEQTFIADHQDRYHELMAASRGTDDNYARRRREALKVMRAEYPADWRHHLRVQRDRQATEDR